MLSTRLAERQLSLSRDGGLSAVDACCFEDRLTTAACAVRRGIDNDFRHPLLFWRPLLNRRHGDCWLRSVSNGYGYAVDLWRSDVSHRTQLHSRHGCRYL